MDSSFIRLSISGLFSYWNFLQRQEATATMGYSKNPKVLTLVAMGLVLVAQMLAVDAVIKMREPNFIKDRPSPSKMGVYTTAAVAANGPECAEVGKSILAKNGSAVDAAIATLLCDGVVSVHSMGLGGGFLMTIWDSSTKKVECLDARETAPAKSSIDMFTNATEARFGGKSIAVPGELHGYWKAHRKYGKLPWADLLAPTIEICERGSLVNEYIAESLKSVENFILEQPTMREILINPATNQTWTVGDRIKRPKLAETLRLLSDPKINPVETFYQGSMAHQLVREIKDMGGIIELKDFANYRSRFKKPIVADLGDLTLYTVPPPGSGIILSFIMNILKDLLPTQDPAAFWQRLMETFKWAYARRSEFGDPSIVDIKKVAHAIRSKTYIDYVRKSIRDDWTSNNASFYGAEHQAVDDKGTANVCVYTEGSAVTVTSTINQYLGAMRRSPSTGIIFNDEMDDFSSPNFENGFLMPPSPANYIAPNKRPMSSMAPTIIMSKKTKRPRMLVGSAGGTKITTAIATTIALHLYAGFNVKEAIDAHRIHHQLFPMTVDYEVGFNEDILRHLRKIGHDVSTHPRMGSTVTAITIEADADKSLIKANADGRREGNVAGY